MKKQFLFDALERRQLLSSSSLAIGDTLYVAEASGAPSGGSDLFKSNLDGSGQVLLKHWDSVASGPAELTAFHGQLFFAANWTDTSYSGRELWKSDGTPGGTVEVKDLYGGAMGSDPKDFAIVNDHLLFTALPSTPYRQIFVTNGTSAGTGQLLNPPHTGYYGSFNHVHVPEDHKLLYATIYNSVKSQLERWKTNGTVTGTTLADATAIIDDDGILRVFGTNSNDYIQLSSADGRTKVIVDGSILGSFNDSDFSGIDVVAMAGDDTVILADSVTHPATLEGNNGNDFLRGGSGNDDLLGGYGNDSLDGAAGTDSLEGQNGADSLFDASGNDYINQYPDADMVVGQSPTAAPAMPTVSFSNGLLTITGSADNDTILIRRSNSDSRRIELVLNGVVSLTTYRLSDVTFIQIDGKAGNDRIEFASGILIRTKLYGGAGNDTIYGSAGVDQIHGGDGNDYISAGAGNDAIYGNAGNDKLYGGDGNDYLDGGAGADMLRGDAGIDRIVATIGLDDYAKNKGDLLTLSA